MPLTMAMWEAVDALCCGYDYGEMEALTERHRHQLQESLREASFRVPGHRNHTPRERILFWRGKQIGVAEYLAGLRDDDGFPIVPRDIPVEDERSAHHEVMFPEV